MDRSYIQDSRFKIQEVFIVNLYRSIHKMFDMLFSTNTTKGGWNHIWLIYPLFHYYNFPRALWALRTVVRKNNRQTKQIHRFSTLIVNYKFVSKTFYDWTWFVDREMVCLQMFSTDFFDFPISVTLIVVWKNELLVNPVFREATHSIILVRQPELRICAHLNCRMQCVNRFYTECYKDDILCCNQNNSGTLWVNCS